MTGTTKTGTKTKTTMTGRLDATIYTNVVIHEALTDVQLLDMVRDRKDIDLGGIHLGRLHFKHVGHGVIYHLDYTDRAILNDTYVENKVRDYSVYKYTRACKGTYYYLPEKLHLKRQHIRALVYFGATL